MSSLALSLFALIASALAGEQSLRYSLSLDGKSVGHRDVTVRYLPAGAGEVRILETWTEIDATLAGAPVRWRNRATAKAGVGAPGFTSSLDENGTLREVQARVLPDRRWQVTVVDQGESKTWTLRGGEVTLSSLDLLDPQRHLLLTDGRASASLLMAEAGNVLTGAVEDLGDGRVKVGGEEVEVHRWAFTPDTGRIELAWTADGTLVSYQMSWMGKRLTGVLDALPPPPEFGEIQIAPGLGGGFEEEKL